MAQQSKLQNLLDKLVDNKKVFGTALHVESLQGELIFSGAAGDLAIEQPYFIASTTKLYTTAMIMKLRSEGKLDIEDKVSKYINSDLLAGLNTFGGVDHAPEVTIHHLLAHTSGFPDYFSGKSKAGTSLESQLTEGEDRGWTFEQAIELAKTIPAKFTPGQSGKALYSDTNYQLLGRIVEELRGDSIANIFQAEIFAELGLKSTYMFTNKGGEQVKNLYYKDKLLTIPQAMASFQADGGIVSTAAESMAFLREFFAGRFFPKEYFLELLAENHAVMFPLKYGIGIMRFSLPRIFTLFKKYPELLGHSGLSGAFAYFCPEKELCFTGTVNQIAYPSISYRLLVQAMAAI